MTNATPAAGRPVVETGATHDGTVHVMIVDADSAGAGALALRLREAGYEVVTFTDTVNALAAAQLVTPGVILLDFTMDDLSNYENAWYLRKFQTSAHTPLIGMSAYTGTEDPAGIAAAYGLRAFLKKPCDPLAIIAMVAQCAGTPAAAPVQS